MITEEEKRKYRRVPANLIAHFRKIEPEEGTVNDVSMGGMFIQTHNMAFEAGQMVQFDVQLPNEKDRLNITGIIRWTQPIEPMGIGVEIRKISATDKARLKGFADKLKRHSTRKIRRPEKEKSSE